MFLINSYTISGNVKFATAAMRCEKFTFPVSITAISNHFSNRLVEAWNNNPANMDTIHLELLNVICVVLVTRTQVHCLVYLLNKK
jgi:hypothetical protein